MDALNKILALSYLLGTFAAVLGAFRYWLEYSKTKKKFVLFGALDLILLAVAFFVILVSVGPHPAWSEYFLKVSIRVAVIGFAVFKFVFEIIHLSTFVSVDGKAKL